MSGLIKYTVEHYKKAGVSDADFVKWFKEVQVANGLPLIKKHGIVKYAIVSLSGIHLPPKHGLQFTNQNIIALPRRPAEHCIPS